MFILMSRTHSNQNKAHTPCVGLCKPISMGALLSILVDDAVKLIKMIKWQTGK